MGQDLIAASDAARACFEEANEALGFDISAIIREGPAERLAETEITQPAILTVSVAVWRAWQERGGGRPAMMAGHSLGEYSALTAAGSLAFADAVRLVHTRGQLMQQAVPVGEGTMAAILGLEEDEVQRCCTEANGVVSPANLNAPGQIVISGATAAVEQAVAACKEAGARRAVLLEVSGPFHSALMRPAAERLAEELAGVELSMPEIPVVHNFDATVSASVDAIRDKLLQQLYSPVRWTDCITAMMDRGVDAMVECGPGKVLAGLMRRIDKNVNAFSISSVEDFADVKS